MIETKAMMAGLAMLGAAFNREITPQIAEVYHGVLLRLTQEQWILAVDRALESEKFFPSPAVLLRYGFSSGVPQEVRAANVYGEILGSYEDGRGMGPGEVRERFGLAAQLAFVAAGGSRIFEWCEPKDQPFRRKAFIEAWIESVEENPALMLPALQEPTLLEGSV